MCEELEQIFDECRNEVIRLHYRWAMYRQVYATNERRIEILNSTASNFLAEVQSLNLDGMVLGLSKLTDPAEQGNFKNLSLALLVDRLRMGGFEEEAKVVAGKLQELHAESEKFRHLRNKKVAHADLDARPTFSDEPLPGVSQEEIEAALSLVREVMNRAEVAIRNSSTAYEHMVLPMKTDGRALLIWLQKGMAYDKLVEEGHIERNYWKSLGSIDT